MEKKGEVLNQLAIISDLIEKINMESDSATIVFELSKVEFEKVFNIVQNKYGKKTDLPNQTFTLTIGKVDVIFNTSNV